MRHIPNILTVFRLLLVPIFVILFFAVAPVVALPVSWLAAITDVLDGYLARRNGWVSISNRALAAKYAVFMLSYCWRVTAFCSYNALNR